MEVCRSFLFSFFLFYETDVCLVDGVVAPLQTDLLVVFGEMWLKWETDSMHWALTLVYSMAHKINQEKRGGEEGNTMLSLTFSTVLYTTCVWRPTPLAVGGAWRRLDPEVEFLKPGSVLKPSMRIYCLFPDCSTGCYSVLTSSPLSLKDTIHRKKNLLSVFSVYFCWQMEPCLNVIFSWMFCVPAQL